jgi:hypothetical protein
MVKILIIKICTLGLNFHLSHILELIHFPKFFIQDFLWIQLVLEVVLQRHERFR